MKPEIKKVWLKALRSGKYRKGRNMLMYKEHGHKRYCCLGVLSELAVQQGVIKSFYGEEYVHRDKVAKWSGLRNYGKHTEHLQEMNDGLADALPARFKTFKTIANWIEKNL